MPRTPGFGVILNLLNFSDLRKTHLVAPDDQLETSVRGFCARVIGILDSMPHNERDLVLAREKDDLCGFHFRAFSGYSYRTKFTAFEEFVSRIPKVDE
jgi:hypothetical protein